MQILLVLILLSIPSFCLAQNVNPLSGALPLEFEANTGQFSQEAVFFARQHDFEVFFTRSGPVFVFQRLAGQGTAGVNNQHERKVEGTVLRMKFVGMNAVPQGLGLAPGTSNYFIGNDASKWHVGVPHYKQIVYRNAYPGVDIAFYADRSLMEYDLIAAPGADLARVRMAMEGARLVHVDRDGALTISTSLGTLRHRVAKVYEERNGRRYPLPSRFAVDETQQVRLEVPEHRPNARLVVDPVLEYSSLLAVDSTGHAYVAGFTNSTDFPTTTGAFERVCTTTVNCAEAFVTKLNPTGTGLVYSTYLGGTGGGESANGIAVDSSGNAYVTGVTRSSDFPGNFLSSTRGVTNAFVTKFNASGTGLVYSALFGGSNTNEGTAVTLDSSRNAYVSGNSQSPDFPTTAGAFQTSAAPDFHPFLVKLNPSGTAFVYATRIGGTTSTDFSHSVAVDSSGNAYVGGEAGSDDFPTTGASLQPSKTAGTRAGFVAKFNASGSGLIYSTFWGDLVFGVAVDAGHDAFVTGAARVLPTTAGAIQNAQKGNGDAFVSKISPTGQALLYSTLLGGSGSDFGSGITVNSAGEAYVLGSTTSANFPVTVTAFQEVFPGGGCGDTGTSPCPHAFVAKLNASATALSYSSYLGGSGQELVNNSSDASASTIALGANGSVYVASSTSSLNFPTTNTAFKKKLTDPQDGFVAKITPLCALKSTVPSLTVCTPANGATVRSPVTIIAGTNDSRKVKLLQVYVDGTKKYEAALSAIEVKLTIPSGTHRITVQAIDTANVVFKTPITVNVGP
jgi:hypothetical protein